ncbi:MAG: thioredoxin domain-containing protein [Ginsengibacter sp.]
MNALTPPFNPFEDHFVGALDAPVELLLYGDFQCEHCADVYPAIQSLREVIGSRMRFVYRHFPQPEVYPLALDAAVASEVAGLQGKFWQMHDILYLNQKYMVRSSISHFAEVLKLDMRLYESSGDYRKLVQKILRDFKSGVESGIDETPTFFINGKRYSGMADFENLCKSCCHAGAIAPRTNMLVTSWH